MAKTAKKTVKKATPKKVIARKKPVTKKAASKEISFKSVGRNVILVIDNQKFTKAFKEKVERDNLKSLVEGYNKRNSLKKEKEIINIMLAEKVTAKERKEEVQKASPKKAKKPTTTKKPVNKMTEKEAKLMLEKAGYTVAKVAPKSRRRGGEY